MIDLILLNGNIITLDERQPRVSALATAFGRIAALGDDPEIRRLAGQSTVEIDLDGKTVLPGLDGRSSSLGMAIARSALGRCLRGA